MDTVRLLVGPFMMGLALAGFGYLFVPNAEATECPGDEYRSILGVTIQGESAPWPEQGSLTPDDVSLWTNEFIINIEYDR